MKINRWIALALIAVLVVGAMGFVSYRVLASTNLFQTQDCPTDVEEYEKGEIAEAEEADADECGNETEDESGNGDANEEQESGEQDLSDEIIPTTSGISSEEAQAIAESAYPGASTLNVEFDREWGREIWEVELDNGLDVQVDANTGEILSTGQRD